MAEWKLVGDNECSRGAAALIDARARFICLAKIMQFERRRGDNYAPNALAKQYNLILLRWG
jgi:hypothetical protein